MPNCSTEVRPNWPRWVILVAAATVVATLALMQLRPGVEPVVEPHYVTPRWAIVVHLATVIPALVVGAVVLLRRKGDRTHRRLGRLWASLMAVTALASFWIRGSDGSLSGIHLLSAGTLVALPVAIWRIRAKDLSRHRQIMISVYIGLIVAGAFALAPDRLAGHFVRQIFARLMA